MILLPVAVFVWLLLAGLSGMYHVDDRLPRRLCWHSLLGLGNRRR